MEHTISKPTILIVEDNDVESAILRTTLQHVGQLVFVSTIQQAEQAIAGENFSMVITDVNLPDGDGFSLIKKIRADRKTSDTPVFVLTGRTAVDDRVAGFALGADDYVLKPYEPSELAARVTRKLQRRAMTGSQTSLVHGHFHADFLTQKISVLQADGTRAQLNLTPIESKLLIHFLQNDGQVFSRQALIKKIWGDSTHVSDHTVDTHISSLRKKIGESAQFIKAIVKKGYCFDSQNKIKQ
jgi:DNA-binding response OmpR family regulator